MADTKDGDQGNTDTLLKGDQATDDQKAADDKKVADDQKAVDDKKVADDQKAADDKKAADDQKKEGAPETYETFKLPEGTTVNEELMGEFNALAKEMNLPQESAQKIIDMVPKQFEAFAAKQAEDWKGTREAWVKDIKEDKELGGEKLNETLERANRTLRNFGSDGLKDFLADSGFGDSSDLVRMLVKLDVALGEDYVVDGKPSSEKGKSAAETLYSGQGE